MLHCAQLLHSCLNYTLYPSAINVIEPQDLKPYFLEIRMHAGTLIAWYDRQIQRVGPGSHRIARLYTKRRGGFNAGRAACGA